MRRATWPKLAPARLYCVKATPEPSGEIARRPTRNAGLKPARPADEQAHRAVSVILAMLVNGARHVRALCWPCLLHRYVGIWREALRCSAPLWRRHMAWRRARRRRRSALSALVAKSA